LIHRGVIETKGNWVTPTKPEHEAYEIHIEDGLLHIKAETQNGVASALTTLI